MKVRGILKGAQPIHCSIHGSGESIYFSANKTKSSDKVLTKDQSSFYQDLNDLIDDFGIQRPWNILVSGTDVLSRKTIERTDLLAAFSEALPGTDPDQFYFHFDRRGNILIARRDRIDEHLSSFKQRSALVRNVQLTENEEKWNDSECISIDNEYISESRAELRYKRKYTLTGLALTLVLILTLTVTFLVKKSLIERQDQLSSTIALIDQLNATNRKLSNSIDRQKELASTLGLSRNIQLAASMQTLANSTPQGIVLDNVELSPFAEEGAKDILNINHNEIDITGSTSTQFKVDEWIRIIEEQPLFNKAELIEYEHHVGSVNAQFKLRIKR